MIEKKMVMDFIYFWIVNMKRNRLASLWESITCFSFFLLSGLSQFRSVIYHRVVA